MIEGDALQTYLDRLEVKSAEEEKDEEAEEEEAVVPPGDDDAMET